MKVKIFILIFFIVTLNLSYVYPQFIEKSNLVEIDQIHLTIRSLGGGATFFDYDNDGFLDLYVTGGGETDKLYLNLGNKKFYDISEEAGITDITEKFLTTSVISGDINNDGCSDLFVTTHENRRNLLLINQCDGTFNLRSFQSGLVEEAMSMGAAFLDFNQDGLLDIYVINYVLESRFITDDDGEIIGFDHVCWPNHFYVNQGNNQFIEKSAELLVNDNGCGLAVATTDLNRDGRTDLYIANDFGEWVVPNSAYLNSIGNVGFLDISAKTQLDIGLYGMGIAGGDFDNDLDIDYYVTNMGKNQLLQNNGDSLFINVALEKGVENGSTLNGNSTTGWGTVFFDFDNDSDLDLFVSNGFIGAVEFLSPAELDPNKLYENVNGTFVDVTQQYGMGLEFRNRGVITGDYDNDGDLDLFVVTLNGVDSLYSPFYENQFSNRNKWVDFQLEGTTSNRDAIGASIVLYFEGNTRIHEISSGGSHASQNSLIAHFGLGEASKIDSVSILWNPDFQSTYYDVPINQKIYIKEGDSEINILGCMDPENPSYNPKATLNSGCMGNYTIGCTDPEALNYNKEANLEGDCEYSEIVTGLTHDYVNIEVYPNPFTNNISVDISESTNYSIRIINLFGNEIVSYSELSGSNTLELSVISNGIYFLLLEDENGIVQVKKIIKN